MYQCMEYHILKFYLIRGEPLDIQRNRWVPITINTDLQMPYEALQFHLIGFAFAGGWHFI